MPLQRLPPKVRSKIASQGNAAVRAAGKIHKFTPEQAREAGRKSAEKRRLNRMRIEQEDTERKIRVQEAFDRMRNGS